MNPIFKFLLLYVFFLNLMQYSCITSPESTDYTFLINEDLFTDSLSQVEAITKFNCMDCPNSSSTYNNMLTPGKNSRIIVYDDSSKTAKIITIYDYNFIESFANSSVSPSRYFNHINKQISNGLLNHEAIKFDRDSMLSTIDTSFIVYSNSEDNLPNLYQRYNLKEFPAKLLESTSSLNASKQNSNKNIFVYLTASTTPLQTPLPDEFNPKKEIYNTMRTFYERLDNLYTKGFSDKQDVVELIKKSFMPGGKFQIQNKDESTATTYTIDQFIERITSNERFQFEDVSIFMNNFSFFKDPAPTNDNEIPGTLQGSASYDQHFKGSNKGVIVYEDVVNKNVTVSRVPVDRTNDKTGMLETDYQFIIESISVNYVKQ